MGGSRGEDRESPQSPTLKLHRDAQADVLEVFTFYEDQIPGSGSEFQRAVAVGLASIARHPLVHDRIRRAPLRRFPYCIYYTFDSARIVVVADAHTSRDPAAW